MALYCSPITANIAYLCALLKAGILQQIYVANLGEIDSITYNADNEVTAITMKVNPITTPDLFNWYRLLVKKQSAGVVNTAKKGTNSAYIEQALTFQVPGISTANKTAFETMLVGQAVFIVQDANKVWHIIGEETGAELQDGSTIGTGIAIDDLQGMQAQFIANETFVMRTVVAGTTIEVLNEDGVTIDTITL